MICSPVEVRAKETEGEATVGDAVSAVNAGADVAELSATFEKLKGAVAAADDDDATADSPVTDGTFAASAE